MTHENTEMFEFQCRFLTEEDCQRHIFKVRWPGGYKCPRCDHDQFYFHKTRNLYTCKECNYQTSVTAGTLFHKTKTPLMKWFMLIFLIRYYENSLSVSALQRLLKFKNYKTTWKMYHKIMKASDEENTVDDFILKSLY